MEQSSAPDRAPGPGLSRRALLGGGALLGGTALGGAVAGHAAATYRGSSVGAGGGRLTDLATSPMALHGQLTESFFGQHQSGVVTPQQAHGVFVGLNLRPGSRRDDITTMLKLLSDDAARMTQGRVPLAGLENDTAALPSLLTVTFGFGPGLFDAAGLARACPPAVRSVPPFRTDKLRREWGQTDLVLQICSEDPVTLSFAQRRLVRDASSFTSVAWAQRGFLNARGTEADGTTARNLMGMRDGSANETDPAQVATVVWGTDRRYPWLVGGCQLIIRRIRIDMPRWDDLEQSGKEIAFGRRISDGSPLTGATERDTVDRGALDAQGFPVVAPNAHAARAQARVQNERMLRRPYNYDDGPRPDGTVDEGLIFVAYQADLAAAFIPVQRRLAEADALNTWTTHIGSAAYAVPPGAPAGSWVGSGLLG
ncbi:MAG TPA: Dyp-type peroxidase [Dermatophilaceae bacterium]|nr:Dyp-type peroxidase [Dermatophilaceae bacterium]